MRGLIRTAGFLGSLGLMAFWFAGINVHQVDAVDPPYVPPPPQGYTDWDDHLVDQKMAQLIGGDPNPYVTDGRFYDVGRIPGPTPTYGDYRFRVTHIKFDYKNNFGTAQGPGGTTIVDQSNPNFDDGFTLMYDQGTNLAHVNDGKAKGEWIYKYATFDPDAGRSEPALYVADKQVKVRARVECAAALHYAYIGAKELREPQPTGTPNNKYPTKWLDVAKTKVDFMEKMPGQVWVSKGPQIGSDAQGNPIFSEYVDLPLVGSTKNIVDRSDIIWQWYADRVSATGLVNDEWTAAAQVGNSFEGWAINKSGEYGTMTIIDPQGNPQTVEIVLPHRFYTVLGAPKYPWYSDYDRSDEEAVPGHEKPWVEALDFAIVTPDRIELRGETSITSVAQKVTVFCYKKYLLYYDHTHGTAKYVYYNGNCIDWLITGNAGALKLDLHEWITKGGVAGMINCYDQALTATTMTALIGGQAVYKYLEPFGYFLPSDFVGDEKRGRECNNPFFLDYTVYSGDGKVGDDDTFWRFLTGQQSNVRKRSMFSSHAWMEFGGEVYDPTAGEANTNTPRMGMSVSGYKNAAIDLSHTAVSPKEDNEELAATFAANRDQFGRLIDWSVVPATDPGDPTTTPPRAASDAPNPNFKNGDMTKVKTEKFSIYR